MRMHALHDSLFDALYTMHYHTEQEVLPSWDNKIHSVCCLVNSIVDKINHHHSSWVASSLDQQMSL